MRAPLRVISLTQITPFGTQKPRNLRCKNRNKVERNRDHRAPLRGHFAYANWKFALHKPEPIETNDLYRMINGKYTTGAIPQPICPA